jgi:hypothetical protein
MFLQRGRFCLILACVLNLLVTHEEWSEGQRWVVDLCCVCFVDRIIAEG